MKRDIKVVFIDFDGTLTNQATNELTEKPDELIDSLKKAGAVPVISTGKGLYFIYDLLANKPRLLDGYFILHDGALVLNPFTGDILHSNIMSAEIVGGLLEKLTAITQNTYLNKATGLFSEHNLLSKDSSLFKFWNKTLDHEGVYQVYVRDIQESLVTTIKDLADHFDLEMYSFASRRNSRSLMIHNRTSNKACAIKKVLDRGGWTEKEAAVIGDGVNDLPAFMLDVFKIAASDAIPELKNKADLVLEVGERIDSTILKLI
ncbi:MAG: HAD family hydrolase [Patescibacteria group bacterium]